MKAFRVTLIVVDHEGMTAETVAELLCDNRHVFAQAAGTEALEIGEWHDAHPLNSTDVDAGAWFSEHLLAEAVGDLAEVLDDLFPNEGGL